MLYEFLKQASPFFVRPFIGKMKGLENNPKTGASCKDKTGNPVSEIVSGFNGNSNTTYNNFIGYLNNLASFFLECKVGNILVPIIFRQFHYNILKKGKDIEFIYHKKIPCGDGGISIGQIPLIQAKLM